MTEIEFKNMMNEIVPKIKTLVKILYPSKYKGYMYFEVINDNMIICFDSLVWNDEGEFIKYGSVSPEEFPISLLFSDIDKLREEKELERTKLKELKMVEDIKKREEKEKIILIQKEQEYEKLKKELGK